MSLLVGGVRKKVPSTNLDLLYSVCRCSVKSTRPQDRKRIKGVQNLIIRTINKPVSLPAAESTLALRNPFACERIVLYSELELKFELQDERQPNSVSIPPFGGGAVSLFSRKKIN